MHWADDITMWVKKMGTQIELNCFQNLSKYVKNPKYFLQTLSCLNGFSYQNDMEKIDLLRRKMNPGVGGEVQDTRHLHGFLIIPPNADDDAKDTLVRPAGALRPSPLQHAKGFSHLEFSGVCLGKKGFQKWSKFWIILDPWRLWGNNHDFTDPQNIVLNL